VAAKNEIGKSAQRLWRGIGVDSGERSGVAGVERIKKSSSLDPADFNRSSNVMLALKVSVWHSTDSRFGFCKWNSDVSSMTTMR
jgi:hypothetical protein